MGSPLNRPRSIGLSLGSAIILTTALCLFPAALHAVTPLDSLSYSPDVTTVFNGGVTIQDEDVAADNLLGTLALQALGSIPNATDVDAYELLSSGDQLLSFDTTVNLPGGLTAGPGDVVRYDGAVYTLEFDADSEGVPAGAAVNAVGIVAADLLLSFDTTVVLGAATANDEDLVRFDGVSFTLFFDGSAAGVATSLDLDGAQRLSENGHLLLSFDGSGTVGGVGFNDEDVLEYDPVGATWELVYDGSQEQTAWAAADLDALSAAATPECSDGLDNDGDLLVDFPADPGCFVAAAPSESPVCDDGIDNDGDTFTDLADPGCFAAWDGSEINPITCGLGFELAFLLPPLMWVHRRRRRTIH